MAVCLSVCLRVCLSVYLCVCLYISFSLYVRKRRFAHHLTVQGACCRIQSLHEKIKLHVPAPVTTHPAAPSAQSLVLVACAIMAATHAQDPRQQVREKQERSVRLHRDGVNELLTRGVHKYATFTLCRQDCATSCILAVLLSPADVGNGGS